MDEESLDCVILFFHMVYLFTFIMFEIIQIIMSRKAAISSDYTLKSAQFWYFSIYFILFLFSHR